MSNKTLQKIAKEWHKNFCKEISQTLQEQQQKLREVCPEFEQFLNNHNKKKGDNYGQTRRKKEI